MSLERARDAAESSHSLLQTVTETSAFHHGRVTVSPCVLPIASLDPESARNVMQTLRDLNQKDGLTVVVTLHQVDYAMRFCPRTVALKKGEIVYDGPTERLTPQFLAELYGAESDELFAAKTSAAQEAVTLPGSPVRETSRAA